MSNSPLPRPIQAASNRPSGGERGGGGGGLSLPRNPRCMTHLLSAGRPTGDTWTPQARRPESALPFFEAHPRWVRVARPFVCPRSVQLMQVQRTRRRVTGARGEGGHLWFGCHRDSRGSRMLRSGYRRHRASSARERIEMPSRSRPASTPDKLAGGGSSRRKYEVGA